MTYRPVLGSRRVYAMRPSATLVAAAVAGRAPRAIERSRVATRMRRTLPGKRVMARLPPAGHLIVLAPLTRNKGRRPRARTSALPPARPASSTPTEPACPPTGCSEWQGTRAGVIVNLETDLELDRPLWGRRRRPHSSRTWHARTRATTGREHHDRSVPAWPAAGTASRLAASAGPAASWLAAAARLVADDSAGAGEEGQEAALEATVALGRRRGDRDHRHIAGR